MLEKGANINTKTLEYGLTPLMVSVANNNMRSIRFLLTRGADVNLMSKDGKTALHIAAIKNNPKAFNALMQAGANPMAVDLASRAPIDYINPLYRDQYYLTIAKSSKQNEHSVFDAIESGKIRLLKYMIDNGADLSAKNAHGLNSLHYAILKQDVAMTSVLIAAGAPLFDKNSSGLAPLDLAKMSSDTKLAQLIDNVNQQGGGQGIVHADQQRRIT